MDKYTADFPCKVGIHLLGFYRSCGIKTAIAFNHFRVLGGGENRVGSGAHLSNFDPKHSVCFHDRNYRAVPVGNAPTSQWRLIRTDKHAGWIKNRASEKARWLLLLLSGCCDLSRVMGRGFPWLGRVPRGSKSAECSSELREHSQADSTPLLRGLLSATDTEPTTFNIPKGEV